MHSVFVPHFIQLSFPMSFVTFPVCHSPILESSILRLVQRIGFCDFGAIFWLISREFASFSVWRTTLM
jgi:hypothetical protein